MDTEDAAGNELKAGTRHDPVTHSGLGRAPQVLISNVETGEHRLDVLELRHLLIVLGVPLATFLEWLEARLEETCALMGDLNGRGVLKLANDASPRRLFTHKQAEGDSVRVSLFLHSDPLLAVRIFAYGANAARAWTIWPS